MYFRLFFVTLCSSLSIISVTAQESGSWKIILNKKAVLSATGIEDSLKNKVLLKKSDLSNNNIFKIEYVEPKNSATKGWVRTIALLDTTAATVAQQDSVTMLQFYNKDMMKILWSRKRINIYTWLKPLDPGMAAAIRVRRFHLCTIELID